jgi:hypothetical protein
MANGCETHRVIKGTTSTSSSASRNRMPDTKPYPCQLDSSFSLPKLVRCIIQLLLPWMASLTTSTHIPFAGTSMTCRYPTRNGLEKLPCQYSKSLVTVIFKDINVIRSFDVGIYDPIANCSSSVHCAFGCFSRKCLAFVFSPVSNTCWQHVTKSVCRKRNKTLLTLGSKLMVRKVNIFIVITSVVMNNLLHSLRAQEVCDAYVFGPVRLSIASSKSIQAAVRNSSNSAEAEANSGNPD